MEYSYGNTINSRWRAYAEYTTSTTNTEYKVTVESGLQNVGSAAYKSYNATGYFTNGSEKYTGSSSSIGGGSNGTRYRLVNSHTYTYARGTSAAKKTVTFQTKCSGGTVAPGSSNGSFSITVPALASYNVTYHANGEDVANVPSAQTKYYGKNLTLSAANPTRDKHTFLGWAVSEEGEVEYSSGELYTGNATLDLYAKWRLDVFTIKFDANGGIFENQPTPQQVDSGNTLFLTDIAEPTRAKYVFSGWSTSPLAAVQYTTSIAPTSSVTLYAVWKSRYTPSTVKSLTSIRTNEAFEEDSGGESAIIKWAVTKGKWLEDDEFTKTPVNTSYKIRIHDSENAYWKTLDLVNSPLQVTPANFIFAASQQYEIELTVTDTNADTGLMLGTVVKKDYLSVAQFTMDFNADGTAICFFGEAPDDKEGLFIKSMSGTVTNIVDMIYPIGSIYMSTANTSPAAFLGGTWEQIKDRFLLSAGDDYSAGGSGGEANHTLTVDEMPSHTHVQNPHKHEIYTSATSPKGTGHVTGDSSGTARNTWIKDTTATNKNTGGGVSHNNMPPYLTVYMWKRII